MMKVAWRALKNDIQKTTWAIVSVQAQHQMQWMQIAVGFNSFTEAAQLQSQQWNSGNKDNNSGSLNLQIGLLLLLLQLLRYLPLCLN